MNKVDKIVKTALEEMFKRVGREYDPIKKYSDGWYAETEWSEEEQDDFRDWLVALCRKELRMRKKKAEYEAAMFILNWGWKTRRLR